ncbi:hypothetical protein IG557_13380 [Vibrio cholerae]|uniref:hypothetical protein n=1 Tax=Vibrio cholerae TaxID=666 RepID=UPI00226F4A38|nr:hypothetical protein [Vibrio cholerae]MCX9559855.1 hypothetical protein [Vibrio cholerae]MCX9561082.1 hypothetical protein [Vibrio cholerae]
MGIPPSEIYFPGGKQMIIIIIFAALCCCLCLCAAQVARLPYRDLAEYCVAFLVLDPERPNTRGPPSKYQNEYWIFRLTRNAPVSVAIGVNRDGGYTPDESLMPHRLKAFAPRTNVRESYRLRRLARSALPFQRKMTQAYQPDLLAVCSVGTDQLME